MRTLATRLSIERFVKQSGGHVTIYSEPGLGTTINLYLPRSDAPSAEATAVTGAADPDVQVRETVLVVEDDSRVRQLTIKRLKLIGYQVREASDGPAALLSATPSISCSPI